MTVFSQVLVNRGLAVSFVQVYEYIQLLDCYLGQRRGSKAGFSQLLVAHAVDGGCGLRPDLFKKLISAEFTAVRFGAFSGPRVGQI